MIAKKDILDAVNRALVSLGRGWTVYRDGLPEQFDRPSYYIELGTRSSKPATRWAREIAQPVSILCIGALNADGNADTDALAQASDDVAELFAIGFVRVGDRALHVDSDVTSRTADDGMEVTITLHYLDEAPGEAETEPPITEVQTTIRAKEE